METTREFNDKTHCFRCRRYIDEDTVRLKHINAGNDTRPKYEKTCADCWSGKQGGIPDVWYGYGSGEHVEENIADPETGKPIPFSSKRGKWEAMQKAGVREAGDVMHGARTTYTGQDLK